MDRKSPWPRLALIGLCGPFAGTAAQTDDRPLPSPALLELGKTTYATRCAICHGDEGNGKGAVADRLDPLPRDFTRGEYRLVSTWEGAATDRDLFLAISSGMPGTAMPPWARLPEETRWGLVDYIKSFSLMPIVVAPQGPPAEAGQPGTGEISVPPRPESGPGHERAWFLYGEACAACHGATGRGDGKIPQRDSLGRPTRPRDLALGLFKGGGAPEELYKRVVLGLPGSPMPSNPYFHGDDGWALTEMIRSLSKETRHPGASPAAGPVVARVVDRLPLESDRNEWSRMPSVQVPLMPLHVGSDPPPAVEVFACHMADRLALSVFFSGASAVSVEFSREQAPPYLAAVDAEGAPTRWFWFAAAIDGSPGTGAPSGVCDGSGCRAFFTGIPETPGGDTLKVSFVLWSGEPLQQVALSAWTELSMGPGS